MLKCLKSLALLALIAVVVAGNPTSYITAYPAISTLQCGSSPYNFTMEAWQLDSCTAMIKYTFVGTPGVSNWGFSLTPNAARTLTISGCSDNSWSSTDGGGNACNSAYAGWEDDGSLVKLETSGCDTVATYYITATLATIQENAGDTIAIKGSTECWTCTNAPYAFSPLDSCSNTPACSPSASSSPSPSASNAPSSSPSPSSSSAPSVSPSPSASGAPSISPSPSASPSASSQPSTSPSPSASSTPSTSPSPSASPSIILTYKSEGPSGGAIAGGVVGGMAAVGAAGAIAAGAGYLVHRWMNRSPTPVDLSSALDSPSESAGGVNALFVDNGGMQPNPLFSEMA